MQCYISFYTEITILVLIFFFIYKQNVSLWIGDLSFFFFFFFFLITHNFEVIFARMSLDSIFDIWKYYIGWCQNLYSFMWMNIDFVLLKLQENEKKHSIVISKLKKKKKRACHFLPYLIYFVYFKTGLSGGAQRNSLLCDFHVHALLSISNQWCKLLHTNPKSIYHIWQSYN